MIAWNIHLVIQSVSLESFEYAHKEVFFSCATENKVDAYIENVSGNMQRTSLVFYITFYFRCYKYIVVLVYYIYYVDNTII